MINQFTHHILKLTDKISIVANVQTFHKIYDRLDVSYIPKNFKKVLIFWNPAVHSQSKWC